MLQAQAPKQCPDDLPERWFEVAMFSNGISAIVLDLDSCLRPQRIALILESKADRVSSSGFGECDRKGD